MALIPPPRANLVRYFGVFAPNNKWRKEIVPPPKAIDGVEQEKVYRLPWAELLRRTFGVDRELCKTCHQKLKPVSIIINPVLADALLTSLGIKSKRITLNPISFRGPPKSTSELKCSEEDYSQAPSDW